MTFDELDERGFSFTSAPTDASLLRCKSCRREVALPGWRFECYWCDECRDDHWVMECAGCGHRQAAYSAELEVIN